MSEIIACDVAILTVVGCVRSCIPGGRDLRVYFESDRMLPTAKLVSDERVTRHATLGPYLDENEVRDLATAANRWPIDPPVGLSGARVLATVEATITVDEKWPNDPPRYSMRIISYRAVHESDELKETNPS